MKRNLAAGDALAKLLLGLFVPMVGAMMLVTTAISPIIERFYVPVIESAPARSDPAIGTRIPASMLKRLSYPCTLTIVTDCGQCSTTFEKSLQDLNRSKPTTNRFVLLVGQQVSNLKLLESTYVNLRFAQCNPNEVET